MSMAERLGRALEQQVLEEVRGPVELGRLVARADLTQTPSAAERTPGMCSVTTAGRP